MPHGQRLKILFVEDEENAQEFTLKALRRFFDADVFVADNGEDAVRLAKEHQPALIIQDLSLNTQKSPMTGWDCIREYRKFNNQVKIIITTANPIVEGQDVAIIKHHAFSSILVKPFTIKELTDDVKRVLEEDHSYKNYVLNTNADVSVQGSPEARALIHIIDNLLMCLKIKFEHYTMQYTVEKLFCSENLKKQKEVFQKALNLLKEGTDEIDDIAKEVEKIKFLK